VPAQPPRHIRAAAAANAMGQIAAPTPSAACSMVSAPADAGAVGAPGGRRGMLAGRSAEMIEMMLALLLPWLRRVGVPTGGGNWLTADRMGGPDGLPPLAPTGYDAAASGVHVKRQTKAYVFGLSAVALWSTVACAFKLALRHVGPPELLLWATLVSALALGITLAAQGRLAALRPSSRAELLRSAGVAALNPFLYYLILFKAYSLLPGQEAQPLNFIWGIVLPLMSIPLLGQRIRWPSLLALVVSFAGVYVIATRGQLGSLRFTHPVGVSLAVGSSILWALYWILNVRDPRDEVVKLSYNFAFGFAFTFVYVLATGQLRPPPAPALLGGAYVGLFEMGITFLLWLKALKCARTTAQVANLIFLAPFVSLVLLHFIAGEAIYRSSVAGLVLIVAGNLLQRRVG